MAWNPRYNLGMLGFQVTGDVGPLTVYTSSRGKKVWFPRSPPLTPASPEQRRTRDRFSQAWYFWSSEPDQVRAAWRAVARRASLSCWGGNLYVSLALKPDAAAVATLARQTGIAISPPPVVPQVP